MKIKKIILITLASLFIVLGGSFVSNAKADSFATFNYYSHPHNVITKKAVRIVKIRNTYPLCNSYAVSSWYVKKGTVIHHVHHSASYDWAISLGGKYTYAVDQGEGHRWFKIYKKHKHSNNKKLFKKYRKLSKKYEKLFNNYMNKYNDVLNEENELDKQEKLDIQESDDNFGSDEDEKNDLYKLENQYRDAFNQYKEMFNHYDHLAKKYK